MQEKILDLFQLSQRFAAVVHNFKDNANFRFVLDLVKGEAKLSADFHVNGMQPLGPIRSSFINIRDKVTAHPPASGFEVFVTVGERSGMWLRGMVRGWGSLMVTGG